jgi:hypothetical protein
VAGSDSNEFPTRMSLRWRSILVAAVALFALVGIADALAAVTPIGLLVDDGAHGPPAEVPWSDLGENQGSGERYIQVQLDGDDLIVHYDVRLPAVSPLLMPLEGGRGADHPDDLVGQLLGEVRVLQWPLAYSAGLPEAEYDAIRLSAPVVHLPPEHGMVRVQIDSEPYRVLTPRIKLWFTKPWQQDKQLFFCPGWRPMAWIAGRTRLGCGASSRSRTQ